MATSLGNNTLTKISLGNTEIDKAYVGNTLIYNKNVKDYFCTYCNEGEFGSNAYVYFDPHNVWSGYYSYDGLNWVFYDGTQASPTFTSEHRYIYWKGEFTSQPSESNYLKFGHYYIQSINWHIRIAGNIMSLCYGDNFEEQTALPYSYCFYKLFYLTDVETSYDFILPATTLTDYCYSNMFSGNNRIKYMPSLPATTLTPYCYYCMFQGCTSLTLVKSLLATTQATYSCAYMFQGCTSLTTAPMFTNAVLSMGCYSYMFYGCTSLTTPPMLPATTLDSYCYSGMFRGCTSLTTPPSLLATTLSQGCYSYMFYGCTSLNKLPKLFATTLPSYCYNQMFKGCRQITVSETTGSYTYRIPYYSDATSVGTKALYEMFVETGGIMGTPEVNTIYYTNNEIV